MIELGDDVMSAPCTGGDADDNGRNEVWFVTGDPESGLLRVEGKLSGSHSADDLGLWSLSFPQTGLPGLSLRDQLACGGDLTGDGVDDLVLTVFTTDEDYYSKYAWAVAEGPLDADWSPDDVRITRSEGPDGKNVDSGSAVIGDLTGDGRADVCGDASYGIACESGPLTGFDKAISTYLFIPYGSDANDLADVTGDGIEDLITRDAVYEGGVPSQDGVDARWVSFADGVDGRSLYFGSGSVDLDGDGNVDLTGWAKDSPDSNVAVLYGPLASGTVDPLAPDVRFDTAGLSLTAVSVGGDLDDDGHGDLFVSYNDSGDDTVLAYLGGFTSGTFDEWDANATLRDASAQDVGVRGVGISDLDGDGLSDIVVPEPLWVFYGDTF